MIEELGSAKRVIAETKIVEAERKSIELAEELKIPNTPEEYRRPYLRKEIKLEIFVDAPKNIRGEYLDANTGLPIKGSPDIGHKPGHEHWREARKAFDERLTQAEFNERMNNSAYYQLEDPSNNRSHKYEDHSEYFGILRS